jgi:hypothetical protein
MPEPELYKTRVRKLEMFEDRIGSEGIVPTFLWLYFCFSNGLDVSCVVIHPFLVLSGRQRTSLLTRDTWCWFQITTGTG